MPSVMVDSNVIFSGIVFRGKPARVLRVISDADLQLAIPEDQLEELYRLFKRKMPDQVPLLEACMGLQSTQIVSARRYSGKIETALRLTRDRKDSPLLACALSINPEYFITGDKDFQAEAIKEKVNVLTPEEFLELFRQPRRLAWAQAPGDSREQR